jgi:flagellar assembly factor FliW
VDEELPELTFPAGLPGFPELRRFALAQWGDEDSPYSTLVALDDPEVRFLVVPPEVFFDDYAVQLPDDDAVALGLSEPDDALVLVLITLGERAEETTANLLGPLVVNSRSRTGAQVVLADSGYDTGVPLRAA